MIISFKGYDDSGGLHINHMNENQPNRTYFHRFGYRIFGIYIYPFWYITDDDNYIWYKE